MQGYVSLVLHAHLPFVRYPEHEKFLEESWLFEAITETYVPLLQVMNGWQRDGLKTPLTMTLSPTLCRCCAIRCCKIATRATSMT
jgi:1,4-alpha-glucan branching enzyme